MSRKRYQQLDADRTELLNLDELYVDANDGNEMYYVAWNLEPEVYTCPLCGGKDIKTQNLFSKKYIDIIAKANGTLAITLQYKFYKYRCLNAECRHIFAKEINFASREDNVTHRLEDKIARDVMQGKNYNEIAQELMDALTKQAVGQIFKRWVIQREASRKTNVSISSLCILTGKTDNEDYPYTLFLNLDDGIRILDIQYGIDSSEIESALQRYNASESEIILTDCDSVIYDIVNDNYPAATYIIPVQYWFKLVREDFSVYASNQLRWRQEPNKLEIILQPEDELTDVKTCQKLLEARKDLEQPYRDYQELHRIITTRKTPWTYTALEHWANSVCDDLKPELNATIIRLLSYREAIHQHELHRNAVPAGLTTQTNRLEEILSKIKTSSGEQLKARVLYSVPANLNDWRGIPIQEVIETLDKMKIKEAGGKKYDYK